MTDFAGPTGLILFDRARSALAEARSTDEVKAIRDQAEAIRLYLRQQGAGLDMVNDAAEIKLRAERRLGELLADQEKNRGAATRSNDTTALAIPTLSEQGIEKDESSRWQRIASVPEPEFEAHVATVRNLRRQLTTNGVVALAVVKDADLRDAVVKGNRTLATAHKEQRRRDRQAAALGREEQRRSAAAAPLLGHYQAIVVDPPWAYERADIRGAAEHHYDTLSVEEIAALPVGQYAAPEAHLYLWITNPHLLDALHLPILAAWEFQAKALLTWVKPAYGTGHYFREATEHVIFAVRGSLPPRNMDIPTWFEAPRGQHSEKPQLFYEIAERMSYGPRLEMFARHRREGWDYHGDEELPA